MSTIAGDFSASVVWDFDFSLLLSCNSDTWIPRKLAPSPALDALLATRGVPWTELMGRVLAHLHACGHGAAAIAAAAAAMPPDAHVHAGLREAHRMGARQYILSDANTLYIDSYLRAHSLSELFSAVHTNPASAAPDGGLVTLRPAVPAHSPHGCGRCPVNLCKGAVLRAWRGPPASGGGRWVYVGDGLGDVCPSLQLGEGDVVLARRAWPLARALEGGEHAGALKARLVQWEDGKELSAALLAALGPA